MLARVLVPALALLLPLAPFAGADAHGACDSKGNVALGVFSDSSHTWYADDRNYAQGNGMWLYIESNGIDWLQRGGSSAYVPNDSEICYDDSPNGPDSLIF
jgi:hypothetical protein